MKKNKIKKKKKKKKTGVGCLAANPLNLQQLYVHVSHCNDGDNKTTVRDAHDSQQSEGGNSHLS